jgi:hypothetical protein
MRRSGASSHILAQYCTVSSQSKPRVTFCATFRCRHGCLDSKSRNSTTTNMKCLALTAALLSLGVAQDDQLALEADNAALQCLDSRVVPHKRPSHAKYADLVEPFNSRLPYKPAVVVLPTTNQHVQDAVLCAAQTDLKVQARCGGHGYASYSSGGQDGHMILNLRHLQTIQLNKSSGVATVGGGVRLGNLASGLWEQGKAVLSHVSTLCDCARAES